MKNISFTKVEDYNKSGAIPYYTTYQSSNSKSLDAIIGTSFMNIYNNLDPGWEIQLGKRTVTGGTPVLLWIKLIYKRSDWYDLNGVIWDKNDRSGAQDINIASIITNRERNKTDSLDINKIVNSINLGANYNSTFGAITSAKDVKLVSGNLGITLPNDLKGTNITYSHDGIDANGELVVTLTISKGFGTSVTKSVKVNATGINGTGPMIKMKDDAKIGSRTLSHDSKSNSFNISLYKDENINEQMLKDLFIIPSGITISSNFTTNPVDSSDINSIQTITLTAENIAGYKTKVMINIKFMSEKEVAKDIFAQIINKIENTGNTSVYYYNFVSKNISYYTKYDNKNKDLINTVLKTNLQDIYANLPSGWEILFGKNTNNKNSPI
ncbi:hypothetical protein [Mycoplasma marinum]|uniref:hypothetical protein n=1 Tax=Mycoplasma marinum TaxID=1937190 RepID=UPI00103ACBEF|nr:hypothetical protein [Mycoplasma marinum]